MGMRRGNQRTGVRRSSSTRIHTNIAEVHEDWPLNATTVAEMNAFFGAFDEVFTDYDPRVHTPRP